MLSLWSSSLPKVIYHLVIASSHIALKRIHTKHKFLSSSRVMDATVYLTSPCGYSPDTLNANPLQFYPLIPTSSELQQSLVSLVTLLSQLIELPFQLLRLKSLGSSLTVLCLLHHTSNLPKYIVFLNFLSVSCKNVSFMNLYS